MGKISKIIYEEIDPEIYSVKESSQFYYYNNLIGISDDIDNEFEEFNKRQIQIHHQLIGRIISSMEIHPLVKKSLFESSTLKHKNILISEC